jgi:hypothetical protein
MLDALAARDGTRLQSLLSDHLANKLVLVMEALGPDDEPRQK